MKTYMADGSLQKNWFVVDAEGETLGRLASRIATVLIGKHKPEYTPSVDTGDYVIVVNTDKIILTGKKLDQKIYYHHTGYPGLKATSYRHLMEKKSDFALHQAVRRMMPKNKIGRQMLKKLFLYTGPEHNQQAQCPKTLEI